MSDFLNTDGIFSNGFGFSPKSVMRDKTLSIEAKAIYAYLASYAGSGMVAFPSVGLICSDLNISERRFLKHRKQLEDKGYITIKRERKESGFSNNIYNLNVIVSNQTVSVQNVSIRNVSVQNGSTNSNNNKSNSINSNNSNTLVASKDAQRDQIDKIVETWNQIEGLPQVRRITETSKRYKYASARLKEEGFDTVVEVIQKVASSDFLRGKNRNNWTANFEWAMTASNFIKILEDTYINKESNHEAGRATNSADKLERIHEEGRRAIEEFDFENFDGTF